jgi:hypothetical protein
MTCPACGCKVHYQHNSDEDFAGDDERLERCAACSAVFDIEDAADDEDEDSPAVAGVALPRGGQQAWTDPEKEPRFQPGEET